MSVHINDLPDTVLVGIFQLLASQRIYNLFRLRLVCQRWTELAADSSLWRKISFPHNKMLNIDVLRHVFAYCSTIRELDLSYCSLVDDACLELLSPKCSSLQVFRVRNCRVSNFGLREILTSCQKLKVLTISYYDEVSITSEVLSEFVASCPELEKLQIFYEDEDEGYEHSFRLTTDLIQGLMNSQIKLFHCENASFSNEDVFRRTISESLTVGIKDFSLPNCMDLTNNILVSISNQCTHLKSLNVSHCPGVNDSGMIAVSEFCPLLEYIDVMACQCITDVAIESIAKHCKNLTFLSVAGCELPKPMGNITDVAIQCIATHCVKLSQLNVKWCQGVTDVGIGAVAINCPGLTHLNACGCLAISDVSMLVIAAYCPDLENLELTECLRITNASINSIAQNCPRLQYLDMQVCSYISHLDFRCNTTNFLPLRHIDLSYCTKISDECVKHITCSCHRLTFISLAGCHRITDAGMKYIAHNCPAIQYLDMSFRGSQSSMHLSDHSLTALARNCPHLTYLDLVGCWNITEECVGVIVECCRYLSQINVSQLCEVNPLCEQKERLQTMVLLFRYSCNVKRVSKSLRAGKLAESFILHISALSL